jgi:hypothetical protein
MKELNYRVGALKRKFKIKGDFKPGDLISKVNDSKARLLNTNQPFRKSVKGTAIKGMV